METGLTNPGIRAAKGSHKLGLQAAGYGWRCSLRCASRLWQVLTNLASCQLSSRAQQALAAALLWQGIAGSGDYTGRAADMLAAARRQRQATTAARRERTDRLSCHCMPPSLPQPGLLWGSLILLMRGAALDEDPEARSCQNLPALDNRLPAAAAGHVGGRMQGGPQHVTWQHVRGCLALSAARPGTCSQRGTHQGQASHTAQSGGDQRTK